MPSWPPSLIKTLIISSAGVIEKMLQNSYVCYLCSESQEFLKSLSKKPTNKIFEFQNEIIDYRLQCGRARWQVAQCDSTEPPSCQKKSARSCGLSKLSAS